MRSAQADSTIAEAADKLQRAITDQAGELRPISRLDFEILPGGLVRWTIWEAGRRLYSATGHASDVSGFLAASKIVLELRASQEAA